MKMFVLCTLLFSTQVFHLGFSTATERPAKECQGSAVTTSEQLGDASSHYLTYSQMYANCTHVSRNLVLSNLAHGLDLGFLADIREIFGSVIITRNSVEKIPLPNLVVIHGSTLYNATGQSASRPSLFSLYVADNAGLKELQMNSLQEILSGDVGFKNNSRMCFEDTINWSYILNRPSAKVVFVQDRNSQKEITCNGTSGCNEACEVNGNRYCWGADEDLCQNLTGDNCSEECSGRDLRCFGPMASQCCNEECAGGCTGYRNSDCLACRYFENDGRCVSTCPPRHIFNRRTYLMEPNPDFKYYNNRKCVSQCDDLKYQGDFCVSQCSVGFVEVQGNKTCVRCETAGNACTQTNKRCVVSEGFILSSDNVETLRNCTHIAGSISLHNITFRGLRNVRGVTVEQLSVFETVVEITDFLYVSGNTPDLKSLSFFRNLRRIRGQKLIQNRAAMFSLVIRSTSLEYLGLSALKEISAGHIMVASNQRLCYMDGFNVSVLFAGTRQMRAIARNANPRYCESTNQTCSRECRNGCWGPGPDKCLQCRGSVFEGTCVESCDQSDLLLYNITENGIATCRPCHTECTAGCSGPTAKDCVGCRHVKLVTSSSVECKAECPEDMAPDHEGLCQQCHDTCARGCTGPGPHLGRGGCNNCYQYVVRSANGSLECLPEGTERCLDGFFERMERINVPGAETTVMKMVCSACHSECLTCYGQRDTHCLECVHVREETRCVTNCSRHFYLSDVTNATCIRCTQETADRDGCQVVYIQHVRAPRRPTNGSITRN